MAKEVILTGIRANEEPHLGNYLGAMLPMVELQRDYAATHQLNMFVPDLHSFTTPIDHTKLLENTIKNIKYFVASGLDINQKDTYIYRQSHISAHSELTWILNCFTYVGEMSRMTQYKEKSTGADNVSVGLFDYPVLMAADILLYNATWVPVGDDQTQHLEMTRDIAIRVNHKFEDVIVGGVFTVPEETKKQLNFSNRSRGVRIRSLVNPEKKMSKSVEDPRGTILLSDHPADAAKKIMGATTDSVGKINFDWQAQAGVTNLLQILALLSGRTQDEVNTEWAGTDRYGDFKKAVAVATEEFLKKFQSAYAHIDTEALLEKMQSDEEAMRKVANATLYRAQQAVGLRPRN